MTRVVLSTVRLLEFYEGGGHFWVYMQYANALRRIGCEVHLLDSSIWCADAPDRERLADFRQRVARYGVERVVVGGDAAGTPARELVANADLLLNFNYHLGADVVSAAPRSALVDIDPGLLQIWIRDGLIAPAPHDVHLTTGETVGTPSSPIPECGIDWVHIRPAVSLDLWPYAHEPDAEAFTTVSTWWSERDYVGSQDDYYDNTKRTAFWEFIDLPRHTHQPLEVALFLADGDEGDQRELEEHGWRVRHSREVAGSPEAYHTYVQSSRGELSWAKASCMRLQNAWVSDRTLCYLASGKPVVVQDTGPSSYLPSGEGMFRFSTTAEAAAALEAINEDYERHSRLARRLAEEYFDAAAVVRSMLEAAL
jgi:glycosyltransferase involved in cell wall biosynthesis